MSLESGLPAGSLLFTVFFCFGGEKSGGLGESGCLDVSEPERTSDMATWWPGSLHRLIFSVFAGGVISLRVDQL
jgi:hypothetical protein